MRGPAEIAVIGGGGFIGRYLVRRLAERGQAVRIIGRQAGGAAEDGPQVRRVAADVSDPEAIRTALEGAEAVFHLATGGGDRWADFERDFLTGGRNVAEACLAHGVRRLVYTSSIAALYLGGGGTADESAGTDPQPAGRSLYSRAKIATEKILDEMRAARGLPVTILRPGLVMGRGGLLAHSGIGYWASDLCCIGWGRGENPLPFVLADDVAAALVAALDAPGIEGRTFNLAGDVRPSAREFVDEMRRRSRRRYQFHPRSLAQLQGIEIFKWAVKCAARKPENPFPSYRDLKSRALTRQLDCSAARQALGWKPVSDRETFLREAIDSHLKPFAPGDLRLAQPWPQFQE